MIINVLNCNNMLKCVDCILGKRKVLYLNILAVMI